MLIPRFFAWTFSHIAATAYRPMQKHMHMNMHMHMHMHIHMHMHMLMHD